MDLQSLIARAITAAASLLLLAAVFVPLERAFPARPGQAVFRPAIAVDACFFAGQYLCFGAIAVGVLGWIQRHLADTVAAPARAALSPLPTWLLCVAAVVLGDLLVYGFHRACHAFAPLWKFHAVHHSARHLDFLAAHREHPLDGLLTQTCQNLPALALGVPMGWLAALAILRGMWGIFIHSNVRLPLGPLRLLLGAPELHHWHHAKDPRMAHNFANLAPWIDVLFGTYHRPEGAETYELGLEEEWPRGYLAQLVHPFALLARPRRPRADASAPS